MQIRFLYFDDCPNWRTARDRLQRVLGELAAPVEVEMIEVTTPAEAERLGFRGSPTILVDGADPFAGGDEPVGLACRVYATPEGLQGSPTVEQLRSALRAGG